jgi:hypothetical protein
MMLNPKGRVVVSGRGTGQVAALCGESVAFPTWQSSAADPEDYRRVIE